MFAQWGLLVWVYWKGKKLAKWKWGSLGWACSIMFAGWRLLVLVYLVGLQSGVCKVVIANWVRFARLGLLNHVCWVGIYGLGSLGGGVLQTGPCNMGFVKLILQCRVCGMGRAVWSFLRGGY